MTETIPSFNPQSRIMGCLRELTIIVAWGAILATPSVSQTSQAAGGDDQQLTLEPKVTKSVFTPGDTYLDVVVLRVLDKATRTPVAGASVIGDLQLGPAAGHIGLQ